MNCLDCKDREMAEYIREINDARDLIEIEYTCPRCSTMFFGTLYRDEGQALTNTECIECEEEKDE